MFFKFQEEMRKIFLEDIDKHNVLAWIIYHTNFQIEYEGLQKYQCYITTRNVASDIKLNHAKVQRILKNLELQGFISYTKKSKSKHESSIIFSHFIAKSDTVNDTVSNTVNDTVDDTVNDTMLSIANTTTKLFKDTVNKSVKYAVHETISDTVVDTSSRNTSNIYSRVITNLNQKTSKKFRACSKKNIALIQARLNEGFLEEDFYRVIDVKCDSWLNDATMNKYLRPETLFGNKFEAYLNEQKIENSKKSKKIVKYHSREL